MNFKKFIYGFLPDLNVAFTCRAPCRDDVIALGRRRLGHWVSKRYL